MATRKYTLVDTDAESPCLTTNWDLCCLCQEVTSEVTTCPANNTNVSTKEAGYNYLATNINAFMDLQTTPLPLNINISRLDDGEGIANTLKGHEAKWHKTCRNAFSNLRLARAQKRKSSDASELNPSPVKTRRQFTTSTETDTKTCFFCDKPPAEGEQLHKAVTDGIDKHVRECALQLRDTKLLAKLSTGDMHAINAEYHTTCLATLYNRQRSHTRCTQSNKSEDHSNEAIALAELIMYMEEVKINSTPVFKLKDLARKYSNRLSQLSGRPVSLRIHTTRLKERLERQMPNITSYNEGRDVLIIFKHDIGGAIKAACEIDKDSEVVQLAKAAKLLRQYIFDTQSEFTGTLQDDCQKQSVPKMLATFMSMVLEGPNIQDQSEAHERGSQAPMTLSQLILFNSKSARSKSAKISHSTCREPPLPLYLGLMLHSHTRQRSLIGKLYKLGLCISYDRILDITAEIATKVCTEYEANGVVCPLHLQKNVFTTGAVDNIDHNPSARTAKDSFHGTSITLVQHPTDDNEGTQIGTLNLKGEANCKIPTLPENYTNVPPSTSTLVDPHVPKPCSGTLLTPDHSVLVSSRYAEAAWFNNVEQLMKTVLGQSDYISWAAYHASKVQPQTARPKAVSGLLPLYTENAHSTAMIRHAMNMVKQAIVHTNPGQTPVITMDQPLFAIGKQIQWTWPDTLGEANYVLVMGGLHIEMAMLSVLGDFINGSGWVAAVVDSEVNTKGKAEAFLKGSLVTGARYTHQVFAATLHLLQVDAYTEYKLAVAEGDQIKVFEDWCAAQCTTHPQFKYWSLVQEMELLYLQFVRSLRTADFPLYLATLDKFAPWIFAFDHHHYARWLPIHIKDMMELGTKHQDVYRQFMEGKFVVQKTNNIFSTIALDHAHEQMNAVLKDKGGIIGLTENPQAMRRWIMGTPEVIRIITEFESDVPDHSVQGRSAKHHEQVASVQNAFKQHIDSLHATITKMGNPFLEESTDLMALDTQNIMDLGAVETLNSIQNAGISQYQAYVQDVLTTSETGIKEPITKNKFAIFSRPQTKTKSKQQLQAAANKRDVSLFSRLYIACQSRDGNLPDFFRHENQPYPPALSSFGELREGTKADLLTCLQKLVDLPVDIPEVDVKIIDGSALVNMLQPRAVTTFHQYANDIVMPYLRRHLQNVDRLDIVWDIYKDDSLKRTAREHRGTGQRKRVHADNKLPTNWQTFLRVDGNKTELFDFLAQYIASESFGSKHVYCTTGQHVLSVPADLHKEGIDPCNHEEADTRLVLHAAHAARQGCQRVMIHANDTDVVVIAIRHMEHLHLHELWVAFGSGKNFRIIPIHLIADSLGSAKSRAITMFHAFSGCDTVSAFAGCGKKTAWELWNTFDDITDTFCSLGNMPSSINAEEFANIERYVVLLYSKSSELSKVNEARQELFGKGSRSIERIPPTEDAVIQQTKRAVFQAGHVWEQATVAMQVIPSPSEWGWQKVGDIWQPLWMTIPEASKTSYELIHCGCVKGCQGLCKCRRANLKCSGLCKCSGNCTGNC